MRLCAWCSGPIPTGARSDAVTCSTRCRQARHRFTVAVGRAPAARDGLPLSWAYADPPYPGTAARYYQHHPDYAGEVDHAALIRRLTTEYDGWALSTSAAALPDVLRLCPAGVRVAVWARGARPHLTARRPLPGWEPVVYAGARDITPVRGAPPRTDLLVHHLTVRTTDPARVIGAKPAAFYGWLFQLLGCMDGDSFADLFPGSGGGARAWHAYTT